MTSWMLRGLTFAGLMVVVRLIQGTIINALPTSAGLVSIVLLLLFTVAGFVWGVIDGRADATANPDPDRRRDLAMTWLLAGLAAGILSGAVSWVIALGYKGLYTGGLINEVTTFAAFTALVVFLAAIVGVTFGRWRVDRNPPPRREGGPDEERVDTDVFSAVRGDDTPTGEMDVPTATAAAPSAVATAEREEPTETLPSVEPTIEQDAPTETIPTAEGATEVIRTDPEPGAEPENPPEKD
jgi:hypothetical protein